MTKATKKFKSLCMIISLMLLASVGLIACSSNNNNNNNETKDSILEEYRHTYNNIQKQYQTLYDYFDPENDKDVDTSSVNFGIKVVNNVDEPNGESTNTLLSDFKDNTYTNGIISNYKKFNPDEYGEVWRKYTYKISNSELNETNTSYYRYDPNSTGTTGITEENKIVPLYEADYSILYDKIYISIANPDFFNEKISDDDEIATYKLDDTKFKNYFKHLYIDNFFNEINTYINKYYYGPYDIPNKIISDEEFEQLWDEYDSYTSFKLVTQPFSTVTLNISKSSNDFNVELYTVDGSELYNTVSKKFGLNSSEEYDNYIDNNATFDGENLIFKDGTIIEVPKVHYGIYIKEAGFGNLFVV